MPLSLPLSRPVIRQARWRIWWSASLSRRLTLGLIVALLASAGTLVALTLAVNQSELRLQQEESARRMVRLFEASLQNAMLKRDLGGMTDILKYLGRAPGVDQARLLNPVGEVRFASHDGATAPEPPVSTRELCHETQCQERLRWSAEADGERLQIVYPIHNHDRCGQCHGSLELHPVNGLLVVDFQPRAFSSLGRDPILLLSAVGLSALALFALIMLVTLRRQVSEPLASLAQATDKLAAGDLEARVKSPARDELGRVAHAFNHMADRLRETVVTLRHERQFLQQLIDGMPDPVVVIGSDYRIHLANHAYASLLGHDLPALVGQHCYRTSCGLNEPCPSTLVTCPIAEIRECARPVRSMISLRHVSGSTVDVDIDAAPLPQEDGQTLVIEVIRPLERTLRFSQQQRLSTIGLLANGVAHEIHNPLASIRIALQASLRGLRSGRMDSEELTDYLELVDHEIDRCVLTTQRMMQMSQTPTQMLQPVNVAVAIDDVLALLREECRVRGVLVSINGVPQTLCVMGDEAELRQVLVNLVHNALHAMPQGGRIDIEGTSSSDGQWFQLAMRDTGCGIAEADIALIFMPFFSRRADGQRGTGLGLAISKAIMERFGGHIEADSTPGQGSCFTLTLKQVSDAALTESADNTDNTDHAPVD
ncbi:MAG: ATP-binding protein [Proteobacteria bacterium]|nr:ATP-binding protein [Pseudomonadota bacterium]